MQYCSWSNKTRNYIVRVKKNTVLGGKLTIKAVEQFKKKNCSQIDPNSGNYKALNGPQYQYLQMD